MRWLTPEQAVIATQVSGRFPLNHGAPVFPADLVGATAPDLGQSVGQFDQRTVRPGMM